MVDLGVCREAVYTKCQGKTVNTQGKTASERERERAGNSPSFEQNNEKKIHQRNERGRGKRVLRWVGDKKNTERQH